MEFELEAAVKIDAQMEVSRITRTASRLIELRSDAFLATGRGTTKAAGTGGDGIPPAG